MCRAALRDKAGTSTGAITTVTVGMTDVTVIVRTIGATKAMTVIVIKDVARVVTGATAADLTTCRRRLYGAVFALNAGFSISCI